MEVLPRALRSGRAVHNSRSVEVKRVVGAGWPWRGWGGRLSAPLKGLGDSRGGLGHSFGNPSKECLEQGWRM